MSKPCEHVRTTLSERTWIERCLDCGAWRMADEVLPLGRWRDEQPAPPRRES